MKIRSISLSKTVFLINKHTWPHRHLTEAVKVAHEAILIPCNLDLNEDGIKVICRYRDLSAVEIGNFLAHT
jgi:hypothetical protein